jgi:gliding motility-associated protein GldM
MNVSAEVLNAFGQFESILSKNLRSFGEKNNDAEAAFRNAMAENPERTEPWLRKAQAVRERSKEMVRYIEDIKLEVVKMAEGAESPAIEDNEVHGERLVNLSDLDAATYIMIEQGRGLELKKKIEDYRGWLLGMIGADAKSVIHTLEDMLSTSPIKGHEGEELEWEIGTFAHLPLAAAVPLLTKTQVDMVSAESAMIDYLMQQTDAGLIKIDNFEVVVMANSDYIIRGGEFKADIFLAASDKSLKPDILLNGSKLSVVDGKGKYSASASAVGDKSISGSIALPNNKTYPFTYKYTVAEPSIIVSPSKMNVLYRGVENPIDVSAAGFRTEDVKITTTNGTLTKKADGYMIVPGEGTNCQVSLVVDKDGVKTDMGKKMFRVKAVPVPSPELDGISGKSATKSQLVASQGIRAVMPADFDFDLKFTVQSFVVFASVDGYLKEEKSDGQMFTEKQRQVMKKLTTGQRLGITEIKARGPSGVVELPDLSIKVR